jgi:hypothetical protein
MCPIKIEDIRMDHIVDYTKNYSTFATAREQSSNKVRIFLVQDSGTVHVRSGGTWHELVGSIAASIKSRIEQARALVPVYKVNTVYGLN